MYFFIKTIEYSVIHGDIWILPEVLTRFKKIIVDKNIDGEMKKSAIKILLFFNSIKLIGLIGDILEKGQKIDEDIFKNFINLLDKNAVLPLLKILGKLKTIHARKMIIRALIQLGPKDMSALLKGLNDSRWYLVRNIIYILRKIGEKSVIEYIIKALRHSDPRVKKEALITLGELGNDSVLEILREYLDGSDIRLRKAALKAVGNIASESAKKTIMNQISQRHFKKKSLNEKKAYFTILSRWNDKNVYDFLIKTIEKKSLWKRSRNYEIKACAAYCLGIMQDKSALPILNKCKTSRDKILRTFSYKAIESIEHGPR